MSALDTNPKSGEDITQWLISSVPTPDSKGKRWSDEEIAQLLTELADPVNKSFAAIATTHGRTRGAIESRARELAVDMIEKGDDAADVERRTRLTAAQLTEAVEKRVSHMAAQKRKKEEKIRAKEEKEEATE